jgi:CRP-like cAMP-binding protein
MSSLIIITGAIVSAFIFGNMAALMATMNKKSTHFDEQLDLVNSTMRQMKLPEDIQDNVLKYMFHIQNSPDLHQDLETFFDILNDPLRKQILYHLHQSLMKKVKLFKNCSSVEQCFFICRLKPVLFLPKDRVLSEGERGDNMYFLNKGSLSVSIREIDSKKQLHISCLQESSIFGEIALLTKLKRTATIVSDDYSNCAYLSKEDVHQIE